MNCGKCYFLSPPSGVTGVYTFENRIGENVWFDPRGQRITDTPENAQLLAEINAAASPATEWDCAQSCNVNRVLGSDVGYLVGWTSNNTPPDPLLPVSGGTYNKAEYPDLMASHAAYPNPFITSEDATTFTLANINDGRALFGSTTAGILSGSNTKTIAQNQLPDVRLFSASTGGGAWQNGVSPNTSLVDIANQPGNDFAADLAWSTTEPTGGRTSSLNGGVTQQDLDVTNAHATVIWCIKAKPTITTGDIKIIGNASIGDVKTGLQSTDHDGWVKLDGRAVSTLTATQQTQATALGFGSNLPNASNSVLSQNGTTLGSVSGNNTKNIDRNQLPNFTLGGTANGASAGTPTGSVSVANTTASMQSAGSHNHGVEANGQTNTGANFGRLRGGANSPPYSVGTTFAGDHTHIMNPHSHSATFTGNAMGNHTHSITTESVNGNVGQQAFDVRGQELSVNVFIYLGA
jgi:hypothetical protein